jgi:plastocyanin
VTEATRPGRRSFAGPALAVLVLAVALVAAACAGGAGSIASPATGGSASPDMSSMTAGASAVASTSSGAASEPAAPPAGAVTAVRVRDFAIEPADLHVSGLTFTLAVTNDGPTIHNVTIRDSAGKVLAATRDLKAGETQMLPVTVPSAGTYVTFCSLPGHESLGTKGTLSVAG